MHNLLYEIFSGLRPLAVAGDCQRWTPTGMPSPLRWRSTL